MAIVGAGPTGALLAILLQRRGIKVSLYERRPDPRARPNESGRSINLALADRGIHALRQAGVYQQIQGAVVPMRGRLIHARDGSTTLQPYGGRPEEVILSISRHRLNQALLDVAVGRHGVGVNFEHVLEAADFASGLAQFRDLRRDCVLKVAMRPMLGADGGGSQMRRSMAEAALIDAREEPLDHGYKELTIPAGATGDYRMTPDALHVWPRGGYMLIALPNDDGSFTATLFLPKQGAVSFASLASRATIERFLADSFPDACALMPDRIAEFQSHPTGSLGTVVAQPWHAGGMAALVGDAAHAIVPFHGQGMNCCFEDCLEFDACIERQSSWAAVFADFETCRKPNTDAIAGMAIENYLEMRLRVVDPRFQLQQALALELERRHPQRFVPRYSMVMFHHEIPYRIAQRRGIVQEQLLAELTSGAATLAQVDFERARREIEARLDPLNSARA
jgi:kynurenine 3-monooxygenase